MGMDPRAARELSGYLSRIRRVGEVRVKVELENAKDAILRAGGRRRGKRVRRRRVEAIVDTGAVMNLLPEDLADSLGLEVIGKTVVTTADARRVTLDIAGPVTLTLAGRTWTTDCLIGPPGCAVLIGQLVLERLDLIVDSAKRTVTVRPESPYFPTLNLLAATALYPSP